MTQQIQTGLLPAVIEGKFNITLTQSNFQKLADEASHLIYNEDNVEKIAEFLKKTRAVKKAIGETHKEGKSEALKVCQDWDSAKRVFEAVVDGIDAAPQREYIKLCQVIADKQEAQRREKERVEQIKQGIESNALLFAKKISECVTLEQLTGLERMINLEKTRKDKYGEYLPDAISRFSELNSILAQQKVTVKELEDLEQQRLKAIKEKNDEELLKIEEKKEEATARVEEAKVVVQETAINQSINSSIPEVAQEVLPQIKARRTTWKYELVDAKVVMAKAPTLLVFELNDERVKEVLKTLKDTDQLSGKTELVLNGIRYYEEKTY